MSQIPNSIEGEAVWVTYTREYVLPGLLFCAMIYYLIRHVFMPVKDLRTLQATLNAAGQEEEEEEELGDVSISSEEKEKKKKQWYISLFFFLSK